MQNNPGIDAEVLFRNDPHPVGCLERCAEEAKRLEQQIIQDDQDQYVYYFAEDYSVAIRVRKMSTGKGRVTRFVSCVHAHLL